MLRLLFLTLLVLTPVLFPATARAQIDPVKRRLLQLGFNQPLENRGPVAAYAYYYYNEPDYPRTNQTLRLALAPVYLDSELGFRGLLGEHTDLALGLAGGGYADSFSEVRGGHYFREESFIGHGGNISASVYHLFNPGQLIPLNGVLRAGLHHSLFENDSQTAAGFTVPTDITSLNFRTGLRFGGREPLLTPNAAMELSIWYEGQFRDRDIRYGYAGDRLIKEQSHLFWSRALLEYTLPESQQFFSAGVTAGISLEADRFNCFRMGGALPLGAEFPLNIPGYYFQEISARRFVLMNGLYSVPLDAARQWTLNGFASTATVDYVYGLEQPGNWHSGVGGGLGWSSRDRSLQIVVGYARGIDALRNNNHGANSLGLVIQWDLEARAHAPTRLGAPGVAPEKSRLLERLFGR